MRNAFFGLPINGLDNFEAPRREENWNGHPVPLVDYDIAVQIAEMVGDPAPAPYEGLQPYDGLGWLVGIDLAEVREAVLDTLRGAGLTVSWEYPGYLAIDAPDGSCDQWAFGTDNGHWTGDRLDADGRHLCSLALGIPRDSGDVDAIVLAIGKALLTKPCPACQSAMEKVEDGYIAEPVMTGTGQIARAIRLGAYWSCSGCEHCEEVARA